MGFREMRDAAGNVVGHVIVCTRGGRSSGGACVGCKRFAGALFLCDFPVLRDGFETTCDRRICATCKTRIGPDRDLCPTHKSLWDFELGVPLVGPQAVPPLKPFVEPAPGLEESPASQLLDAPGLANRVAPSGGDSGQQDFGEKAEANRTGGGFAEPVYVEADAFRPVLSDDDMDERLQQLEFPEE